MGAQKPRLKARGLCITSPRPLRCRIHCFPRTALLRLPISIDEREPERAGASLRRHSGRGRGRVAAEQKGSPRHAYDRKQHTMLTAGRQPAAADPHPGIARGERCLCVPATGWAGGPPPDGRRAQSFPRRIYGTPTRRRSLDIRVRIPDLESGAPGVGASPGPCSRVASLLLPVHVRGQGHGKSTGIGTGT